MAYTLSGRDDGGAHLTYNDDMARRVKSRKEKSIEADIAMFGAERTRLVTQAKRDENYHAALSDLEKRIAGMREALEQAREDDFND